MLALMLAAAQPHEITSRLDRIRSFFPLNTDKISRTDLEFVRDLHMCGGWTRTEVANALGTGVSVLRRLLERRQVGWPRQEEGRPPASRFDCARLPRAEQEIPIHSELQEGTPQEDWERRCVRLERELAEANRAKDESERGWRAAESEFARLVRERNEARAGERTAQEENTQLKQLNGTLREQLDAELVARREGEREVRTASRMNQAMEELRERLPFFARHLEHLIDHPGGFTFPSEEAWHGAPREWHCYYLLMSYIGEAPWQYLVQFLSFPSWRTIQVWRAELLDSLKLTEEIFDGEPEHLRVLMGLIGEFCESMGFEGWNDWTLTCDAVSGNPSVEITPEGDVHGLIDPMKLDPEVTRQLLADENRFRDQVAEWAKMKLVANSMHIIAIVSTAKGVPTFPIARIIAPCGKANAVIVSKLRTFRRVLVGNGNPVSGLSTDGDNSYLGMLSPLYEAMRNGLVEFDRPLHDQPRVAFQAVSEALRASVPGFDLLQQRIMVAHGGDEPFFDDEWNPAIPEEETVEQALLRIAADAEQFHSGDAAAAAAVEALREAVEWFGLLVYSDGKHQIKCGRYRIVKKGQILGFPCDEHYCFSVDMFRSCKIPAAHLQDGSGSKQDDVIAARFYSGENLERIWTRMDELRGQSLAACQELQTFEAVWRDPSQLNQEGRDKHARLSFLFEVARYDFKGVVSAYWSIVPFLCMELVLTCAALTPSERLWVASYGFCFVYLYDMGCDAGHVFGHLDRRTKTCKDVTLLSGDGRMKYLTFMYNVAMRIVADHPARAGAFGTMLQEHLHAILRRSCNGDARISTMNQALERVVVMQQLRAKTGVAAATGACNKRQQGAEVTFPAVEVDCEVPILGDVLRQLIDALRRTTITLPDDVLQRLELQGFEVRGPLGAGAPAFLHEVLGVETLVPGRRATGWATTGQERIVAVRGFGQYKQHIAVAQIGHA
jgi:hypothetical protein